MGAKYHGPSERSLWDLAAKAQAEVEKWPGWKRRAADTALVSLIEKPKPAAANTPDAHTKLMEVAVTVYEAPAGCWTATLGRFTGVGWEEEEAIDHLFEQLE